MEQLIRLGKVSAIDYKKGMAQIVYHEKDDSVTRYIPFLSFEYSMPAVGDMMLVLHLSNGQEAGVVLGRPWSEKNVPPEYGEGLYRKDFAHTPGEAYVRYKDGTITIHGGTVVIEGDLDVNGQITSTGDTTAGGVSLQQHTHTDSVGGTTSPPG